MAGGSESDRDDTGSELARDARLDGTATVLVVDDEGTVRETVRRVLTAYGYAVLEAEDGGTALTMVEQATEPIHLVLADVVMPGMNGLELVVRLAAVRRELPVLLMSGYSADSLDWRLEWEGNAALDRARSRPLLAKPFSPEALARAVRAALDGAP